MNGDDPYIDSKSGVLRNKLGIRSTVKLDRVERELVAQRISEGVPDGDFTFAHLKAIHRHLFQDVYAWAGEIRTVEINKGGDQFQFMRYIDTGMADVYRRLEEADFLRGLGRAAFAAKAGEIIGDINHVHPFREGNGRTQLQYLNLLATQAGHGIDLTRLTGLRWIAASRLANRGDYDPMAKEIEAAIA